MQSLTFRTHVGKDGILKLETPIGIKNTELEVVLVLHPLEQAHSDSGWPDLFFTEIIGGWEGVPLVRESQGSYETRSKFE
ncbi:MAG: hypothetical protein ACOYYU_03335 [Chloroflexota bacterium]